MQVILGAGGAIGNELAKELKSYDEKVRLFSRNPQKVNEDDDYEFYSFDEFLEEGAGYELVEDKSYFSGTPLSVEE